LGSGEILSFEKMKIYVSNPFSRDYSISNTDVTFGQTLYRVDLKCTTEKSLFCYTNNDYAKSASRIILAEHSLNNEQNESFNKYKEDLSLLDLN
jgi:hypothetical protein